MPAIRMILSSCVVVCGLAGLAGCASVPPLPPKAIELNRDGAAALAAGDLGTADAAAHGDTDDDDAGYGVTGRGLLVWSRGDERRYQEPPLCSGCAAAIGVSALQRWEIEEEEG